MKPVEIIVEEVQVSELRKSLKTRLDYQQPLIVCRNREAVGILLPIETSRYGGFEHPIRSKRRALAELEAALAKLPR